MDEIISIITPDHVELDFSPAGIGSRLLALIIDQILVYAGLLTLLLLLMFAGAIGAVPGLTDQMSGTIVMTIAVFLIFFANWGYFVLFRSSQQGTDARQALDWNPRGTGQRPAHRMERIHFA
jgi:uncharacterized RDD family membrane protein YckC